MIHSELKPVTGSKYVHYSQITRKPDSSDLYFLTSYILPGNFSCSPALHPLLPKSLLFLPEVVQTRLHVLNSILNIIIAVIMVGCALCLLLCSFHVYCLVIDGMTGARLVKSSTNNVCNARANECLDLSKPMKPQNH